MEKWRDGLPQRVQTSELPLLPAVVSVVRNSMEIRRLGMLVATLGAFDGRLFGPCSCSLRRLVVCSWRTSTVVLLVCQMIFWEYCRAWGLDFCSSCSCNLKVGVENGLARSFAMSAHRATVDTSASFVLESGALRLGGLLILSLVSLLHGPKPSPGCPVSAG